MRYLAIVAAVVAVFVVTLGGAHFGSRTAEAAIMGDADCDGSVTSSDALWDLRSAAGLESTTACTAHIGDVNCDGEVGAADAVLILRYVVDGAAEFSASSACSPIGATVEPSTSTPSATPLQVVSVEVPAINLTTDTGITVHNGDILGFHATGTWCLGGTACGGPGGISHPNPDEHPLAFDGADFGTLLGTIGGGSTFVIGSDATIVSDAEGELQLLFNDRPCCYGDNSGSVSVSISIWSSFTPSPTPTPRPNLSLKQWIDAGDRDGIAAWGATRTIAQINAEVEALDSAHLSDLPKVLLYTNGTQAERNLLLAVMGDVLSRPNLGFYAEIWAYTYIDMSGGGFFGTCNHVWFSPASFDSLTPADARGYVMHESFHSFDCVNSGPSGALDEGAAIWIIQAGYPETQIPGNSWAETTYGTKLYYRDLWTPPQPDYPLLVASNPSAKLIEMYTWLASQDPSGLPWNSQSRLTHCYENYFKSLDRNVDFFTVWMPAVQKATAAMQADPLCHPL